jgi:PA14 domain
MKRKYLIVAALVVLALLAVAIQPLLAQNGNTWYIQYYSNPNWSGSPVMVAYNTYIDFNWGNGSPGPAVPADNWTATMTSSAYFNSGTYYFSALADDEISLQIDGVTYLNTIGAGMSGKPVTVGVPLAQGTHNLLVQYREYTGAAYVYLSWSYAKPGTTPTVMPPAPTVAPVSTPSCNPWWSCTCPTQATSVTTQYGSYATCIQQNLHQSNCFVPDGQWDSPNMGSIQMEPPIQVWGNCTPGALQCMQLTCNQEPVQATCSKTGAGWFYYGPCPNPTPTP